MKKDMAINKETFEATFTTAQQEEIKDTLKAFDKVNVIFENGEYHFSTGIGIYATYAPDHKFIGTVYAEDIFTEEERILNYMESFHAYHPSYRGRRDYKMIHEVGNDWSIKFRMEDGNIVKA